MTQLVETASYIEIGEAYRDGERAQLSNGTISRLQDWVERTYEQIVTPRIWVEFVDYDPYQEAGDFLVEARADIETFGRLKVTTLNNNCPHLPGELNLKARAIHDMLHIRYGYDFSWEGECAVTRQTMLLAGPMVLRSILMSEGVGQVAYYMLEGEFPNPQWIHLFSDEEVNRFVYGG